MSIVLFSIGFLVGASWMYLSVHDDIKYHQKVSDYYVDENARLQMTLAELRKELDDEEEE